jgi:hypothetical protein
MTIIAAAINLQILKMRGKTILNSAPVILENLVS